MWKGFVGFFLGRARTLAPVFFHAPLCGSTQCMERGGCLRRRPAAARRMHDFRLCSAAEGTWSEVLEALACGWMFAMRCSVIRARRSFPRENTRKWQGRMGGKPQRTRSGSCQHESLSKSWNGWKSRYYS